MWLSGYLMGVSLSHPPWSVSINQHPFQRRGNLSVNFMAVMLMDDGMIAPVIALVMPVPITWVASWPHQAVLGSSVVTWWYLSVFTIVWSVLVHAASCRLSWPCADADSFFKLLICFRISIKVSSLASFTVFIIVSIWTLFGSFETCAEIFWSMCLCRNYSISNVMTEFDWVRYIQWLQMQQFVKKRKRIANFFLQFSNFAWYRPKLLQCSFYFFGRSSKAVIIGGRTESGLKTKQKLLKSAVRRVYQFELLGDFCSVFRVEIAANVRIKFAECKFEAFEKGHAFFISRRSASSLFEGLTYLYNDADRIDNVSGWPSEQSVHHDKDQMLNLIKWGKKSVFCHE